MVDHPNSEREWNNGQYPGKKELPENQDGGDQDHENHPAAKFPDIFKPFQGQFIDHGPISFF
jgi:hypothetical protein